MSKDMTTTVLLATLGGLTVTVAGVLGAGSSTALVIGLVVLAPMAASVIQMAVRRSGAPMDVAPARALASIHGPLGGLRRSRRGADLGRLFSTHPNTDDRVARLLGHGQIAGP